MGPVSAETALTLALASPPVILVPVSMLLFPKPVIRAVTVFPKPRRRPLFSRTMLKAIGALPLVPAVGTTCGSIEPLVLPETLAVIPKAIPPGGLGMASAAAHKFSS